MSESERPKVGEPCEYSGIVVEPMTAEVLDRIREWPMLVLDPAPMAERQDLMGTSWHEAARRTRDLIEANANKDGTIDPVYRAGEALR